VLLPGTCGSHHNPSYSGDRDQEDHSSKPAWANSSRDPTSKKNYKKGLVEWLKVKALSSNPSTASKIIIAFSLSLMFLMG
jgi:hypothetical protein